MSWRALGIPVRSLATNFPQLSRKINKQNVQDDMEQTASKRFDGSVRIYVKRERYLPLSPYSWKIV